MYREIKSCNRLLQKKWQERDHQIHLAKLEQAKSRVAPAALHSPLMLVGEDEEDQRPWRRGVNKKKLLLQEEKCTEIERENRILYEKMYKIMQKSRQRVGGVWAGGGVEESTRNINAPGVAAATTHHSMKGGGGGYLNESNRRHTVYLSPLQQYQQSRMNIALTQSNQSPMNQQSPRQGVVATKRLPKLETYTYKTEQKRIHGENMLFLQRLMKKKSQYDQNTLREKREQEESMLRNLCQFPHIFNTSSLSHKTPSNKEKRLVEFQRINEELMKRVQTKREQSYQTAEEEDENMSIQYQNQSVLGRADQDRSSLHMGKSLQDKRKSFMRNISNQQDFHPVSQSTIDGDIRYTSPSRIQMHKPVLKPFELGESYGIPANRKVLFRRLTFTKNFHKILIELSKYKKKFYIIVKRYLNDKFKYYVHEMFWLQAKKILMAFDGDYKNLVDATIKINTAKGKPPVDFHLLDKYLYGPNVGGSPGISTSLDVSSSAFHEVYNLQSQMKQNQDHHQSRNLQDIESLEEDSIRRSQGSKGDLDELEHHQKIMKQQSKDGSIDLRSQLESMDEVEQEIMLLRQSVE